VNELMKKEELIVKVKRKEKESFIRAVDASVIFKIPLTTIKDWIRDAKLIEYGGFSGERETFISVQELYKHLHNNEYYNKNKKEPADDLKTPQKQLDSANLHASKFLVKPTPYIHPAVKRHSDTELMCLIAMSWLEISHYAEVQGRKMDLKQLVKRITINQKEGLKMYLDILKEVEVRASFRDDPEKAKIKINEWYNRIKKFQVVE